MCAGIYSLCFKDKHETVDKVKQTRGIKTKCVSKIIQRKFKFVIFGQGMLYVYIMIYFTK